MRTYRAERNQTVISLLDNGRVMAGRVDDVPRVEHAMDAVMMLTAVATRLGDRAGLVVFDRDGARRGAARPRPRPAGPGDRGDVRRSSRSWPRATTSAPSPHTLARFRRRAMLVLFTDLVEQAVGETLLPALPLIARNHLVVVAAVQDPDVVRWARDHAHRRRRGLPQGRRRAAPSTSAAAPPPASAAWAPPWSTPRPGRLAPLLADAYLKVKATGRL